MGPTVNLDPEQDALLVIDLQPDFMPGGALAVAERLPLAVAAPVRSPCLDCADKPCLRTCPVGAVQASGFARDDCRRHVRTVPGNACRTGGCLARLSCPVGRSYHYGAEQASFHMDAVVRA